MVRGQLYRYRYIYKSSS